MCHSLFFYYLIQFRGQGSCEEEEIGVSIKNLKLLNISELCNFRYNFWQIFSNWPNCTAMLASCILIVVASFINTAIEAGVENQKANQPMPSQSRTLCCRWMTGLYVRSCHSSSTSQQHSTFGHCSKACNGCTLQQFHQSTVRTGQKYFNIFKCYKKNAPSNQ